MSSQQKIILIGLFLAAIHLFSPEFFPELERLITTSFSKDLLTGYANRRETFSSLEVSDPLLLISFAGQTRSGPPSFCMQFTTRFGKLKDSMRGRK